VVARRDGPHLDSDPHGLARRTIDPGSQGRPDVWGSVHARRRIADACRELPARGADRLAAYRNRRRQAEGARRARDRARDHRPRAKHGIAKVRSSARLARTADYHSWEMLDADYCAHESRDGGSVRPAGAALRQAPRARRDAGDARRLRQAVGAAGGAYVDGLPPATARSCSRRRSGASASASAPAGSAAAARAWSPPISRRASSSVSRSRASHESPGWRIWEVRDPPGGSRGVSRPGAGDRPA
jgi:hypothetical protein